MSIRRAMRSLSYAFNRTRWTQAPFVKIDSLACSQDTITVRLPKGEYRNVGTNTLDTTKDAQIDATFFIGTPLVGTPTQVLTLLGRDILKAGELSKYIEGNNRWLLSREVCILNGVVCFMSFPTNPRVFVVGTVLMENQSRMAKAIKERVIPDIVNSCGNTVIMKIVNTAGFIVSEGVSPRGVVTKKEVEKVLLDNIDKMF